MMALVGMHWSIAAEMQSFYHVAAQNKSDCCAAWLETGRGCVCWWYGTSGPAWGPLSAGHGPGRSVSLLLVSFYSLVSFLLCYTPDLTATFSTLVSGRLNEKSSVAGYVYLCVCSRVTGDPEMGGPIHGICLWCNRTAALGEKKKDVLPFCVTWLQVLVWC